MDTFYKCKGIRLISLEMYQVLSLDFWILPAFLPHPCFLPGHEIFPLAALVCFLYANWCIVGVCVCLLLPKLLAQFSRGIVVWSWNLSLNSLWMLLAALWPNGKPLKVKTMAVPKSFQKYPQTCFASKRMRQKNLHIAPTICLYLIFPKKAGSQYNPSKTLTKKETHVLPLSNHGALHKCGYFKFYFVSKWSLFCVTYKTTGILMLKQNSESEMAR